MADTADLRIRFSSRVSAFPTDGCIPPLSSTTFFHFVFLDSNVSAFFSSVQLISLISRSIIISSPFSINAISPPKAASGPTCPITKPTEPPENLPSVISPTTILFSRQRVVIRDVESSISGMPGAPLGPS